MNKKVTKIEDIDPDLADSLYKGGYNAGVKHTRPSDDTRILLENCVKKEDCISSTEKCYKNNISPIMEEIKNLSDQLNEFKLGITTTILELPNKLENKFASKTTEKVVYGMIILILVAFAGSIINNAINSTKSNIDSKQISEIIDKELENKLDQIIIKDK